ncbi:MAG: YkvA family protein [Hyphomicrobiales bacterium]|nr:YkvA family protein [Hyphomicrobiales bacterium]
MSEIGSKSGELGPGGEEYRPSLPVIRAREQKVRTRFWDKFRRVAGKIPFADDLVAAYYCALDTETPLRVRGMLLGALAYFILPADAVPDIIAGIGFTDDAAVLAAVVSLVSQHIKPRHRVAAARALDKEFPDDIDTV